MLNARFLFRVSLATTLLSAAAASAQPAPDTSWEVYFGNLHSHTRYSDGSGLPKEAYKHARDKGKLDFLAITEHNHPWALGRDNSGIGNSSVLYEILKTAADDATKDGQFVALYGQEWSLIDRGNHCNVFEVPKVINAFRVPSGKYPKLLDWLGKNPDSRGKIAVVQLNHPYLGDRAINYGVGQFNGAWVPAIDEVAQLIEIANGPAKSYGSKRTPKLAEDEFKYYLNLGFHLAPTANQDNHYRTWGTITEARTGLLAKDLSRASVLDAMRNRRCYASLDKNLELVFTVNGAVMGSILPKAKTRKELDIRLSIRDRDEPDAEYEVEVFWDKPGNYLPRAIERLRFKGDGDYAIPGVRYWGGNRYLYLKVHQSARDSEEPDDLAWTAPVWIEPDPTPKPGPGPGDGPRASRATALPWAAANKDSALFHLCPTCPGIRDIPAEKRVAGLEARTGRSAHDDCLTIAREDPAATPDRAAQTPGASTDPRLAPLLLDAAGAARLLGLGPTDWQRLQSSPDAPRPLDLAGARRWRRTDLEAWINRRAAGPR